MNKLLIISHTEHYKNSNGEIVGWGSTVTEINYLATQFDEIYHLAVFLNEDAPPSSLAYTSEKIHFIPLKPTGGKKILHKFDIVWNAPSTIFKVLKLLHKVDVFQLRTPTGIGVYLIPFLTLFVNKKGWFKYAGNWNQEKPPFGYAVQRWWLKKQHKKVTINGAWENQPKKCLTFENPCLTEEDRVLGNQTVKEKKLIKPYNFCFVGGLNENKGVQLIMDAFCEIAHPNLGTLHIVGDGVLREELEIKAKSIVSPVIFHGFLNKASIIEIYKTCHFILLPSKSEGFPKVIGEAMNFGCIPIVSDVSCIGQYIQNNNNGFLLHPINKEVLIHTINQCFKVAPDTFKAYLLINYTIAEKFTYAYYLLRIQKEILTERSITS
ncbi:glycosyltransferase [Lutibacter sp.]|uniref:glycosyltransferase n=1 Tax=Lutibacter sp. TaxID=1925666 RepID=UPI00349FDE72